ncbi:Gfo/Idh/MocA family protein [Candidatus Clostridium radicumherbarum]|uniref:Gfo/Idh/MocA family protein n=1 Tax=Candidatus Clostridium radicumherbarum TaxID=3381662 RepID=A0ABW8TM34_9CLOT
MSSKMINFGIIGTNKITGRFIEGAGLVEEFKLNAVYSRTFDAAKAFADNYEVTNIFTSLEEMAKDECIDAVYIASPNSLHAEQAILFLNNGKHVLCEKPIASNAAELESMFAAARASNVLLMEAMKSSFLPNFKVIQDNLHKVGKVRRFFFNYCQYSSRYDLYKQGKPVNTFEPRFSNGSIMDIGVYCIHPAVRFFGIPKDMKATAIKLPSGVDGLGTLNFLYDEMEGVIQHSKISNSYIPSEIQGENGSMIIDKINSPEKVKIIYRNGEVEELSLPQIKDDMYYEVNEFIELIKNNKVESEINSHSLSLNVIKLIESARKQTGVVFPADK